MAVCPPFFLCLYNYLFLRENYIIFKIFMVLSKGERRVKVCGGMGYIIERSNTLRVTPFAIYYLTLFRFSSFVTRCRL